MGRGVRMVKKGGVRKVKKGGGGGWDREFGLFRKVEVDDGKGGRMVKKGGGGGWQRS